MLIGILDINATLAEMNGVISITDILEFITEY